MEQSAHLRLALLVDGGAVHDEDLVVRVGQLVQGSDGRVVDLDGERGAEHRSEKETLIIQTPMFITIQNGKDSGNSL